MLVENLLCREGLENILVVSGELKLLEMCRKSVERCRASRSTGELQAVKICGLVYGKRDVRAKTFSCVPD